VLRSRLSRDSLERSGGTIPPPLDIDDIRVRINEGARSGGDDEEAYLRCAWGGEGGLLEEALEDDANGTVDWWE
jgi:hypothetical protein